jgi:hypothetical protein
MLETRGPETAKALKSHWLEVPPQHICARLELLNDGAGLRPRMPDQIRLIGHVPKLNSLFVATRLAKQIRSAICIGGDCATI